MRKKPKIINTPENKGLIVKLIHTKTGKKVIKFPSYKEREGWKIHHSNKRFWRREVVYSTSLHHPSILKAKRSGFSIISPYYGKTLNTAYNNPLNKLELASLKNILKYLDRKDLIYSDLTDRNLVRTNKNKVILIDLESILNKNSPYWLLSLIPPKYRKKNDQWIDREKLKFGKDPLPADWHWEIYNLYKYDHDKKFNPKPIWSKILNYV